MVEEKASRETWRDWLPKEVADPPLVTRAALVRDLDERRADVAERTLRTWENLGIVPRPVRRMHAGTVQALYPDWFVHLVIFIRGLRAQNHPLQQIRPNGRALFHDFARLYGAPYPIDVAWSTPIEAPQPVEEAKPPLSSALKEATQAFLIEHGLTLANIEVRSASGQRYIYSGIVVVVRGQLADQTSQEH